MTLSAPASRAHCSRIGGLEPQEADRLAPQRWFGRQAGDEQIDIARRPVAMDAFGDHARHAVPLRSHTFLPQARTVRQSPEIEDVDDDDTSRLHGREHACDGRTGRRQVGCKGQRIADTDGGLEPARSWATVHNIRGKSIRRPAGSPNVRRACASIDSLTSAASTRSPQA